MHTCTYTCTCTCIHTREEVSKVDQGDYRFIFYQSVKFYFLKLFPLHGFSMVPEINAYQTQHIHLSTHKHTHTYTCTCMLTHTHPHTHTHTHTHAHTHTLTPPPPPHTPHVHWEVKLGSSHSQTSHMLCGHIRKTK